MTRGRLRRPCCSLTALPAVVLVDELLPLARGQAAIGVPVLAQALALLRRHGAELLVAPLEHLLPLLGELLVALVVLPRAPLLLGGELLPRPPVPLLGARGRRREREQDDGDGGPAPHPFEGGSCPSGVAGARSASSAAASRTRRRVACSSRADTAASIGSPASAVSIRSVTASSRRHAAQAARCPSSARRRRAESSPSTAAVIHFCAR